MKFPVTIEWEEEDHRVVYVRIHEDGHLEYADGYEPDEAAQRNWEDLAAGIRAANSHSRKDDE